MAAAWESAGEGVVGGRPDFGGCTSCLQCVLGRSLPANMWLTGWAKLHFCMRVDVFLGIVCYSAGSVRISNHRQQHDDLIAEYEVVVCLYFWCGLDNSPGSPAQIAGSEAGNWSCSAVFGYVYSFFDHLVTLRLWSGVEEGWVLEDNKVPYSDWY